MKLTPTACAVRQVGLSFIPCRGASEEPKGITPHVEVILTKFSPFTVVGYRNSTPVDRYMTCPEELILNSGDIFPP